MRKRSLYVILAGLVLSQPVGAHKLSTAPTTATLVPAGTSASNVNVAVAQAMAASPKRPSGARSDVLDDLNRGVPIIGLLGALMVAATAITNAIWTRRSNAFANSVGMYRRYLELCVQYPQFAEPFPIDRYKDSNELEYRQYQWFVGVLFRACEEVLDHGREKGRWKITVLDQLRHHREFIDNNPWLNTGGIDLYCGGLRSLITQVRYESLATEHA